MTMKPCRECKAEISTEAKACPHCGAKNPAAGKKSVVKHLIEGACAVFIVMLLAKSFLSAPSCKILAHKLDSDIFLVNGEADAGYYTNLTLKNEGKKGDITIGVTLSTSEGTFERTQELLLDEGEERQLSFTFTEPTVNASNIQARYKCKP